MNTWRSVHKSKEINPRFTFSIRRAVRRFLESVILEEYP